MVAVACEHQVVIVVRPPPTAYHLPHARTRVGDPGLETQLDSRRNPRARHRSYTWGRVYASHGGRLCPCSREPLHARPSARNSHAPPLFFVGLAGARPPQNPACSANAPRAFTPPLGFAPPDVGPAAVAARDADTASAAVLDLLCSLSARRQTYLKEVASPTAVAWSPPRAEDGACWLAVRTADGRVRLFAPPARLEPEWRCVSDLTDVVVHHRATVTWKTPGVRALNACAWVRASEQAGSDTSCVSLLFVSLVPFSSQQQNAPKSVQAPQMGAPLGAGPSSAAAIEAAAAAAAAAAPPQRRPPAARR